MPTDESQTSWYANYDLVSFETIFLGIAAAIALALIL